MAPHEIRTATQRQLRETRDAMMSLEFLTALQNETPERRQEAGRQLSDVQLALLQMRTAQLAAIRDQLVANEAALTQGTADLQTALQNLQQVAQVMATTARFLGIVARVVALL